jgi:sentrin-specific protease 1
MCGQNDLFLSTYFYESLFVTNGKETITYENVGRLLQKQNKNAFDFNRIFVPINQGKDHWSCVVCFMDSKEIVYYDSIQARRKHGTKYTDAMYNYLVGENSRRDKCSELEKSEWSLITAQDIPVQPNGYDCGIFVCFFSDILSLQNYSPMPKELPSGELLKYRELLALWLERIEVCCVSSFLSQTMRKSY